jgi:hypothetical protein
MAAFGLLHKEEEGAVMKLEQTRRRPPSGGLQVHLCSDSSFMSAYSQWNLKRSRSLGTSRNLLPVRACLRIAASFETGVRLSILTQLGSTKKKSAAPSPAAAQQKPPPVVVPTSVLTAKIVRSSRTFLTCNLVPRTSHELAR